ncbi:fibronectin type III domain-containing protein [Vibrio parahaemolyticus]|uniref:fibronectin type III domain-containing protein n=1 Tax=Vibrio parahaemolyticus TaxID=670 RepID=UPI0023629B90|nr:fibronectin type III domain-containing protein [Vibrio parahaemolyticus]
MGLAAATVAWISVGLSVGATIYTMTQMPDNKSNDSIAGTKVTKNGTQSPRNRVYGTAIVGCTYVYSNVLDRDQSYRLDVFSVGGVGAVRFHNVWIDDVKMFDEDKNDLTDPANASSGIYDASSMRPRYKKSDGFKMQWRSGQENQVAAKLAIDNSDGEWTVNHRGACVPHIVIYADYSTNQDYVFFSDRYNINALVTGAEVFDPRTGQVNGESSNTALATLDFLMNDYYGMGVTVDYINMESFKYGATFCEDNDLRINSAIDASAKFADILQDMLACCGGALAIVDGKITFLVEEKVLAPVYELDEDSILKNSLKVSPADSGSYYNVVSTTFKSEINRDNDDDFVIPQNAASDPRVMADGKIITKSLKMPYARDAYEAEDGVVQHCVKYMTNLVYNKAKFQMSCSFDIDLHEFSELRPWDVIGVSSEIYGFKNKLFRVQSMKVATDADRFNIATIHCIEYDHSVYEGTVEGTGSLPRPKPDDNVPAPKNVMFTLSSFVNTGYGLLAWEASCFTPSTAYDIEYKLSSASKWTRLTSAFRGTQFTLTDLKEARYDFRVRTYELFLGSSDWTTVTNVNVRPAYVIPEVTGLKVETSTPNFKFTWDDMTNVEVDNIPSSDAPNSAGSTGKLADVFHQYSIQIVVNGVMKYATTTKESVFTLDLEKNKEMMGGQPSRVITFRISIEDRLGNSSLVTELVANNRQIGVAGDVDVTNANGSATVEWSPCFEPDFAGTEVHISTTKGFTPSASTLHATLGKESFYVFPFPDKTTRYMRIAHFDTMGRDGLQYSPEITLTYDGVESAKSVRLISDSQTFHVNKSGVAAPSLIIMSAFTQNVEGSVKWTTSPSVALATTSNPNERILKYASMGNHDNVKVTVTVDGVTDTMTICKVRDGHDGQDGQDGSNGQDGNTIYEQYRYGQVINPDASWTAWGADMRTSDIYRQTRRVINDVPQAAGRVHRIAGMDGSNGADGERLFVVYHKNPVNQRPMPPEGAGNTGGWTEDSDGANWMSQKLANTIDQPLTFWSFPIQMKGNDGEVDYSHVDEIAEAKKNEAIEASIASATASVEAAEVRAKAYADGVATDAEKAAIAAADAKANAAETKAKAYADGVVTEAEQAAIAEAERLAAQAEANAKAASDPKGSASKAQQAAIAAAEEKANAAKVFAQAYADGVASEAEKAAITAANAAANAAEVKAKAYADGEITKAEQAAIDEAERLAAEAERKAKDYTTTTVDNLTPTDIGASDRVRDEYNVNLPAFHDFEQVVIPLCRVYDKEEGTSLPHSYVIGKFVFKRTSGNGQIAEIMVNAQSGYSDRWNVFHYSETSNVNSMNAVTFMKNGKKYYGIHLASTAQFQRNTFKGSFLNGSKDPILMNPIVYRRSDPAVILDEEVRNSIRVYAEDRTTYTNGSINVNGQVLETEVGAQAKADAVKEAADAAVEASEVRAKAYADGVATEAEQAAIAAADAKAQAAETKAKAYADGIVTESEQASIAAAQAAAKAAETRAKAYADGEISKAEQAAITEAERLAAMAEANAKAASDPKGAAANAQSTAQAYAKAQAEAAELRAKQASDPKGSATKAQQAAIAAADAKVTAAKTAMEAYADGVANDAEQAAILAAQAKADAAETKAKAYADGEITKAEQAAIDEAERLAAQAEANAKALAQGVGAYREVTFGFSPTEGGSYHSLSGLQYYTVSETVLLKSCVVNASKEGTVTIRLYKGHGKATDKLVAQKEVTLTKGVQRIELGFVFDKAVSTTWTLMRDGDVPLYRHIGANTVTYPREAGSLVTPQSSAGNDMAYYYFYNLEVAGLGVEGTPIGADAVGSAAAAKEAAEAYALAKANLAETKAKAYADGVVTEAEQAAIDEAERLAAAAQENAKIAAEESTGRWSRDYMVNATKFAEVLDIKGAPLPTQIGGTAGYSRYLVTLTTLGTGTRTEYAAWLRFDSAKWVVTTIKASGTSSNHPVLFIQDNKPYIKTYHEKEYRVRCTVEDQYVSAASAISQSAKEYADASANAAEVKAKAYADGIVTESEQAAINAAEAAAKAAEVRAKAYADGEVTKAEQAAIAEAERLAAEAEAYAKARAEATLNTQFVHSGFIERDGLNFRKKSGVSQWDGWASSKQTFTGGCSLTFTAGTTNAAAMCGITTPNMGGAGYNDIDFCFYIRSNGTLAIYENGTRIADYGNYTVGTVLTIRYDGVRIRYFVNGVLKREVGTSANLGFVADMSIYDVSTGFPIQGLTFSDSEGAVAWAKDNLDNRIPQANADALKAMMANEGLRYYKKITVGGDANKYYPVIIHGGDQNKLRTIKIWRSYAETAPNSWNTSTHKGALMMTWQGNFGGWGGAVYRSTLLEHSEAYSDILADCYIVNHSMGFAFFLRGGGAVYHIASDMDISGVERTNPSGGGSGIYLDGTLNSFVHATSSYNAPDALSAVNRERLMNIKTAYNGQGQYIKNLNADNITAGKIAAQYVHADVYNGTLVNATNIKAGMLDADHINTRTFTGENAIFDAEVYGGVLTGAVVRTGSTGARAEMREDGYKFAAYNAQNKPTFYVDANGNVVMNSGSISSNVLSEASRNSNIVTWIGTAGKGGNMQFTDNLVLQNDVTYFPITNNFYTTGKNGVLNVQYCAAQGYLFQDEKSAVGAAAPAQKTLPANAAPTVYFVDASNATKGSVIRMTIKYTTQFANGTAASKSNPSGTQGWRKTYAHFHIDNVATRPNVATATNVKGYKLCINLGASSIKTALKALKRVPDTISYHEDSEGGRYLPHSYKVVWSGNAAAVTNSWGEGLYYIIGTQRSDWRNCGFVMVTDENHHSPQHRSIYGQYDAYYEYRYDTKQFKASKTHIAVIIKLSGV